MSIATGRNWRRADGLLGQAAGAKLLVQALLRLGTETDLTLNGVLLLHLSARDDKKRGLLILIVGIHGTLGKRSWGLSSLDFAVMLHMTLDNHTHTSRYKAAAEELYFLLMGVFLDTPWLAKKSFICLLPPTCIALISFSVHESICTERTKLMWTYAVTWASGRPTPNPRCCPEHSRQINVP